MTKRLKQYKEKNSTCFLGLQGENLFLASLLYLHSCCWGPVSKQTRVLSQYSGWWGGAHWKQSTSTLQFDRTRFKNHSVKPDKYVVVPGLQPPGQLPHRTY